MRCRSVNPFIVLFTVVGLYFIMANMHSYIFYISTNEQLNKPTSMLLSSLNTNVNISITTTTTMRSTTTKKKLDQKLKHRSKTVYPLTIDSPYLINNPDICKGVKNLTFIIIVHTAPDNANRRLSIRQTWANKYLFKNISLRIVFLLGKTNKPQTQFNIDNENLIYRDIVQGDFMDTYRNLTHKGVLGFRWITENCQHAKMVIKVDDDVYVNIFKLYNDILPKYKNSSRYILCHVREKGTSRIIRAKDHLKWKVNDDEFRGFVYYPTPYCNGYAVFIAPDLIRGMFRASYTTPFFWIDDVYLYGLLPSKISNVTYHSLVNSFTLNEATSLKCFSDNKTCKYLVGNAWRSGSMDKMWLTTLAKLDQKSLSLINNHLISDSIQLNLNKALYEINKDVHKMFPPKPPPKPKAAKKTR